MNHRKHHSPYSTPPPLPLLQINNKNQSGGTNKRCHHFPIPHTPTSSPSPSLPLPLLLLSSSPFRHLLIPCLPPFSHTFQKKGKKRHQTANSPYRVQTRYLDPIFSLTIGLAAAGVRIRREELEAGRWEGWRESVWERIRRGWRGEGIEIDG